MRMEMKQRIELLKKQPEHVMEPESGFKMHLAFVLH